MGTRILAPLLILAVVAAVLLQTVPDETDRPLVPDTLGWPALAVEVPSVVDASGTRVAWMRLQHAEPDRLLSYPVIKLLFATRQARPDLKRGRLTLTGTSCAFETAPGARLGDNEHLAFHRGAGCFGVHVPPGGAFSLELLFRDADRVDVWTYVPPANRLEGPFLELVSHFAETGSRSPVVRGRLIEHGSGAGVRRITLLNYVWQVSTTPTWIWLILFTATVLLIAGAFLYPWGPLPDVAMGPAVRAAVAAACFAGGLGLFYAVLVPPFHAPDEPDHLLSYAKATGQTDLAAEAEALARLGHFERIKFHSDERFRPADVGTPFGVAWGSHVFAEDAAARNPVAFAIRRLLAPALAGRRVSHVLLTVRAVNVLVFALAAGIASALLTLGSSGLYRQLAVLPVLAIPTLPFFAMHFSDLGPLTSFYLVFAASVVVLSLDGPRSHLAGLPLGLSSAFVFSSGRSAAPMAAVLVAVLAGRVVLGTREAAEPRPAFRASVMFWGLFALGASMYYLLTTEGARAYQEQVAQSYAIDWAIAALRGLNNSAPWALAGLLGCALIEVGVRLLRRRYPWTWPRQVVAWAARAAAAVLLVQLVISVFVALPTLDVLESRPRPAVLDYVADVLGVMSTSFRVGRPDHLLVESFWVGFGWVDALPGPFLPATLMVVGGFVLVALLVHLARARDGRRLALLAFVALGLAGSLAVYAASSLAMGRNLYGRYLVGWYLVALSLVWSLPMTFTRAEGAARPRVTRPAWLLGACGVMHAYCQSVVLQRYF